MTTKEDIKKALDGLADFIIMNDTGTDESASAIEWHGIIKKALERAKKVEEFIINTFIECDEFGMEPTIPTHENGQQIVTRWRKELEELK